MRQDQPVGQRCQGKTFPGEDENHQYDQGGRNLKPPGRVVMGLPAGPCQDQEKYRQPGEVQLFIFEDPDGQHITTGAMQHRISRSAEQ